MRRSLGRQDVGDALEIPYPTRNGQPSYKRYKPDIPPQGKNGKPCKYLTAAGCGNRLYFPANLDSAASTDPSIDLLITEGEKKALKANQEDFPCIGLAGVWCWRGKDENGRSTPLADLDSISWKGRRVFIVFDSDAINKPDVLCAETALAKEINGRGGDVRVVRLPGTDNENGKVGLDDFLVRYGPRGPAELRRLMESSTAYRSADDQTDSEAKKESQAAKLINLTLSSATLFHDQYREPHARVKVGHSYQIRNCRSEGFSRWMLHRFFASEGKAVNGAALADAKHHIEALAVFEGKQHELHNRVAATSGEIWIDMSDENSRAIRVTSAGWEIVPDPPILFVRYRHQAPQCEPNRGGDVHQLFKFISVRDWGDQVLLLTWLVSCLIPDIPHPIPQGSGKSFATRILRKLVDPSQLDSLSFPRDKSELVQLLSHHWIPFFDNVDNLQPWQSDMLCRACTGDGISKRVLYSDDDDFIYKYKRCIGLNGINIVATRPDLLDRSMLIGLERILPNERREESEILAEFEEARPCIVGGLLDALVTAIQLHPGIELKSLPRMADFARWGCAIAEALGWCGDEFLQAYDTNISEQNNEVLFGHPVAAVVMSVMADRDHWEGRPADLLEDLRRRRKSKRLTFQLGCGRRRLTH